MLLTPSQKKAVEFNKGPLLIIAGAGTGKTTVLVEKIKYLLQKKLAKPEEILALTFTEKAAREIEERVDVSLPYGIFQMHISTFHSFCDTILRDEAIHIGLSPAYHLQTPAQSIMFIRQHIFTFKLKYFQSLGNPTKFVEALYTHFSRLRDENISPEEYLLWAKRQSTHSTPHAKARGISGDKLTIPNKVERLMSTPSLLQLDKVDTDQHSLLRTEVRSLASPNVSKSIKRSSVEEREENAKYRELSKAYKIYQELKLKENILDFADLIFYTSFLFKKRPNILYEYQKRFRYIMIDEFQDTNIAQYELIKQLAPPTKKPTLTVIGDDNQSIYKFRGAAVSNILQFMSDYKTSHQVVLTENFRSNQQILDSAYALIINNNPDTLESKLSISKNLKSAVSTNEFDSVMFHLTENIEMEADYVADTIIHLKNKNKDLVFSDFAILARANNHTDYFIQALVQREIPYQFLGQSTLFKQPEVKDLISYLKVLYDISDSASLYRLLSAEIFDINKEDIARLLSFSRLTGLSLFDSLKIYLSFFYKDLHQKEFNNYKTNLFISDAESREKFYTVLKLLLKALSRLKKDTASQILFSFLEESGWITKLQKYKNLSEERMALNISLFFDKLKAYEMSHEDASVFAVVDYLNMSMELGESPLSAELDRPEYDAVNILTVHSAKGLEFPIVFLVNLVQGRFPTIERKEKIPIPNQLIKELLPVGDYHQQEERRLFYVAMTRAKKKLFLTASKYYGERRRMRKLSPFVFEALGKELVERELQKEKDQSSQLTIFDAEKLAKSLKPNAIDTLDHREIPKVFSYTQINTYEICPLRYKYQYVLKIPTLPNFAASFGESIHQALYQFYLLHKRGEEPQLTTLLDFYESSWIPFGYKTKVHKERMKIVGKKFLKTFYKTFHNKNIKVIDLEKKFKIRISNSLFLSGKIDRVDKKGSRVEIIDYKTGASKSDDQIKKDLQLPLYALAAHDNGLYNKKIDDIMLTFHFLQDNKKITRQAAEIDLTSAKNKIIKTVENINKASFEPKAGTWCNFCPFRINCEAWQ